MASVDIRRAEVRRGESIASYAAGVRTVGEFRCSECGYGIICRSTLPICPMCHGSRWEESCWRPFARARRE